MYLSQTIYTVILLSWVIDVFKYLQGSNKQDHDEIKNMKNKWKITVELKQVDGVEGKHPPMNYSNIHILHFYQPILMLNFLFLLKNVLFMPE